MSICPAGRRHQVLRQAAAAQLEMQWQLVAAAQPAASQNKTPSVQFPAGHDADQIELVLEYLTSGRVSKPLLKGLMHFYWVLSRTGRAQYF